MMEAYFSLILVLLASVSFSETTSPDVIELQSAIRDLHLQMQQHDQLAAELSSTIQSQQEEISRLQTVVEDYPRVAALPQGDLRDLVNATELIGFSAYSSNGLKTYSNGSNIDFQQTTWNSGTYITTVSTFRCPVNGLYLFSLNVGIDLRGDPGRQGFVNLIKANSTNEEVIASVRGYTSVGSNTYYDQASTSLIVNCQVDELVFAKAANTEFTNIQSGSGFTPASRLTQFSGVMVASY